MSFFLLCYILLLHRTTTTSDLQGEIACCVISYFYIEPQPRGKKTTSRPRCVISYFYIEPQLTINIGCSASSCVISYFYIEPQPLQICKVR